MSEPSKIDFAKYRTPELLESVMNLIDIRGIYVRSAKRVAIGMLALGVVGGLLFWSRTDSIYWFAPIVLYCFLVGAIMGLFYAIAEVIRHSLSNMLKVVELMLEVTKKVAADVASVSEGKSKMPSARELVEGVYREVLLPTVERAITSQLGFVGKPVLFLYRMTLGRVVNKVIQWMPDSTLEKIHGQSLEQEKKEVLAGMSEVAANESKIVSVLNWTQAKVVNVGARFRFAVMLPCYLICFVLGLVLMIPLVVIWFQTELPLDPLGFLRTF